MSFKKDFKRLPFRYKLLCIALIIPVSVIYYPVRGYLLVEKLWRQE